MQIVYPENIGEVMEDFEGIANDTQNRGFLKEWKARGITLTFWQMMQFDGRKTADFQRYMRNCLTMEGFDEDFCDEIAIWLRDELQNRFIWPTR